VAKPWDYTQARARYKLAREEYTRWFIQNGDLHAWLPPYEVGIVALTGSYVIFSFGYVDEVYHWIGYSPIIVNRIWWLDVLSTVKDFYLKGQFTDWYFRRMRNDRAYTDKAFSQ